MLLEKDRIAQDKTQRENLRIAYEEQVKIGKSSERLLNNPDWRRISDSIDKALLERRRTILDAVKSIILDSDTTADSDHSACNRIRRMYQEIDDYEYFVNLPKREQEVGEAASQALAKLRGEESNGR